VVRHPGGEFDSSPKAVRMFCLGMGSEKNPRGGRGQEKKDSEKSKGTKGRRGYLGAGKKK